MNNMIVSAQNASRKVPKSRQRHQQINNRSSGRSRSQYPWHRSHINTLDQQCHRQSIDFFYNIIAAANLEDQVSSDIAAWCKPNYTATPSRNTIC
jgi:hypothetical protein